LGLLGSGLLVLCVVVFLLVALGPHLFGYRTATMLTGSMAPGIKPGDVILSVQKPASEVAVGDVISYHIPVEDHRVETHRVVEVIHHDDGSIAIRTKGDANQGADPWTATLEGDTVWETKAVIPGLGSVIRTLRTPAVQHGVFWVAFGGLLVLGLSLIWGRGDDEDDPDAPNDEDDPGKSS
jgi:signal peptidase I